MTNTSTNALLNSMKQTNNIKFTENGAVASKSTFSPLLDLFGEIGSLRCRDEDDIIYLFKRAYGADKLLALKTLFYARDIRGGLGERNTFRVILKHLALNHPEDVIANVGIIPEYGRWDDLFVLMDTPAEAAAMKVIATQFSADIDAVAAATVRGTTPSISLLGKWMPSENTSSSETRALATKFRKFFDLSSRQYRKALTALRSAIRIVESKMSSKEWSTIDYTSVPSVAAHRYKEAFSRHDAERYAEFINKVSAGEAKINASTLYPYDLVREYLHAHTNGSNPTTEAQWKALPDYITPDKDFLIMADVSGSMAVNNCTPLSTSVGLAIYFAERSKGAFANHFITFTDIPKLVNLPVGLTLREKVDIVTSHVGFDTNLESAFELVLKSAVRDNVPPEDMPTAIVIISDMEINDFGYSTDRDNTSFTEEMSRRFAEAGYIMPTLVYWNVNARADTFHAEESDDVRFVSGSSPSVFKGLCDNLGYSALELMLAVINDPRYDAVRLGSSNSSNKTI